MLQRYHDEDLSEHERAQVESGLSEHPDAQLDLDEIQLIGEVLRQSSADAASDYDPARVWSGLQAQLGAEPAAASDPAAQTPGFLDSFIQWLTPPRLVPIGALAAAAVAWMVISTPGPTPPEPSATVAPVAKVAKVAEPAAPKLPPTAVAQAPTAAERSDSDVIVDSVEAEGAEVFIGKTAGDEGATVIWLFAHADTALETQ